MTRNEIKLNSIIKEIEKYNKSKARVEKLLEKKIAICEKHNCNWSKAEWFENRDAGTVTAKQGEAYFDMSLKKRELDEINSRLANAEKRLATAEALVEAEAETKADNEVINEIESSFSSWYDLPETVRNKIIEEAEAEYKRWLELVKTNCEKDGVEVEKLNQTSFEGLTPNGKKFWLYINSGSTERSYHCYSLTIDGNTVFTSGKFGTAYRYIRSK